MSYTIASSDIFTKWFDGLKNRTSQKRLLARIARLAEGHFGEAKCVAPSLYELRFFFGSGFRIYYTLRDKQVVLLISGGDESTQAKDLDRAKQILRELE